MQQSQAICIYPNQKFSFIALSTKISEMVDLPLGNNVWATSRLPANLDTNWKEWIGSLRAARLGKDCNLFLCATIDSRQPAVLDEENRQLSQKVMLMFDGLMLAGNVELHHTPVLLSGAYQEDGLTVRQISDLRRPLIPAGVASDAITGEVLQLAAQYVSGRLAFANMTKYDRFARIWAIYERAICEENVHERLHDFCRCIEGFILPDIGKTRRQFMSRTEVFIGERHHETMKRLYDMRSNVEHMHEYEFPEVLSERERRLNVMRMSALSQGLARLCIGRFLTTSTLWPYYTAADALHQFWKLDVAAKKELWGIPIDLAALDRSFDPKRLANTDLGLG